METILAATDFSSAANNAVHYAFELAGLLKTRIILVHACPVPSPSYEIASFREVVSKTCGDAHQKLENIKKEMSEKYNLVRDIECMSEIGHPYEVIDAASKKYKADLIVLGITGEAGKIKEHFVGSTAITAARNLTVPTFIIPEGVKYHCIKKIGFACNIKESKETDMIFIVRCFSEIFSAELDVIKVGDLYEGLTSEKIYTDSYIENKLQSVKHKTVQLEGDDIAHELEDYFNSNSIDMIILCPKKHNLFYYLFNNSVTKGLAFHAKQPILAIH